MPSQKLVSLFMDMRGLQVEHNVAMAGMVRYADGCWRSNSYTQELGTRRSAQPRIGADFAAKLVQCTED